ncbi:DsbA family oxidoreductase [Pelagibaculum spongiae]|uniref:Disulfide bond formation protein DsbA n=1 Tax=Pelagibaculum spongiae TaxID=2080658 RepID=A0A2V1H6J5_9GAMM|nr:DsbA family oxidoreductase [Pelagibaculum spongiae]PVZ72052.1 disulfide bond formation protein DsbA [Pelagibaculum spongiae]
MKKLELRIDIISDVVCPWCIIGYKQLEKAISLFQQQCLDSGQQFTPEIYWHPFLLNPETPAEGTNLRQHLMGKYGLSAEQSDDNRDRIIQLGQQLGFEFNFHDDIRTWNTFDIHRLLHWVSTISNQQQTALKLALFDGYFTDAKPMNDFTLIAEIAGSVGLDKKQAMDVLQSDQYAEEINTIASQWRSQGISSVPAYVFDKKFLISGGQDSSVFVDFFKQNLLEKAS